MARVEYRYMGATLQGKRGDIRGLEFAVDNGGPWAITCGWLVLDKRVPIVPAARPEWLSESAEVWADALEFT